MSKKDSRKIYIGIFAVALVALAADRLFFGDDGSSPAQASASSQTVQPPAELLTETVVEIETAPPDNHSLARRLESLAEQLQLDPQAGLDAFAPNGSWAAGGRGGNTPESSGREFIRSHRLTSVLPAGEGKGSAIVDEQFTSIGQELDGFKLIGLKEGTAVFQAGEETVELELESGHEQ